MSSDLATYRLRLAQIAPVLGDLEANLSRHLEIIAGARRDALDGVIFPELSLTGYHLRDLVPEVALRQDSPVLARLAESSDGLCVIAGYVAETEDYSFRVAQGVFDHGKLIHVHHKVYLPTYGMFDEERYLSAGADFRSFRCSLGKAAVMVCEELWHPSAVYLCSLQGISLLIAVADSPGRGVTGEELDTSALYRTMLGCYSQLFQVNVVFVNRVGFEDGVGFWGGSQALDPFGRVVAEAPTYEEELLDVTLSEAEVRRARVRVPLLSDERPRVTLKELRRILNER